MTDAAINNEAQREALLVRTRQLAAQAREEDLGAGDVTSAIIAQPGQGQFRLVAKQPCVLAGREIAQAVLDAYEANLRIDWAESAVDGTQFDHPPHELAEVTGPIDKVLAAERVLLNFLQRLCGVATLTRRFVDAVAGTNAEILDTRKTTPGWRLLEKYAVRCGGGRNHRMGLYDAVLIKDNHLAPYPADQLAGAVFQMLNRASSSQPAPKFIEVEADTLEQVEKLLTVVGIDVVLLDNFSLADLRQAVELRRRLDPRDKVKLEASGGVTLATVRDIALTGVDYISVGAITHSATAVDLSLERMSEP